MKNASDTLIRSAHVRLDKAEDQGFQQLVDRLQTSRSRLSPSGIWRTNWGIPKY